MKRRSSDWKLVHVADFPVPSPAELEAARKQWVDRLVWFYVGDDRWCKGKVYAITKSGEVKIAVLRGDTWVHRRVIRLEYVPRVLRLAGKE
jgi:hypothetical protein